MSTENNSLLKCTKCGKLKEVAIVLPCFIYCDECANKCLNSIGKNSKELLCQFCDEVHLYPRHGFKTLNSKDFEQIKNEESFKRFQSHLTEIDKKFHELKTRASNPSGVINEHCLKLKNQVQLETEILIKKIQDLSEIKMKEIDQYREKCLKLNKPIIDNSFLSDIEEDRHRFKKYLVSSQDSIKKANDLGDEVLTKIEEEKEKIDLSIFNGSIMQFHQEQTQIPANILGHFQFGDSVKRTNEESLKFSQRYFKKY